MVLHHINQETNNLNPICPFNNKKEHLYFLLRNERHVRTYNTYTIDHGVNMCLVHLVFFGLRQAGNMVKRTVVVSFLLFSRI